MKRTLSQSGRVSWLAAAAAAAPQAEKLHLTVRSGRKSAPQNGEHKEIRTCSNPAGPGDQEVAEHEGGASGKLDQITGQTCSGRTRWNPSESSDDWKKPKN